MPDTSDAVARVLIAGFGRVGQMVAGLLDKHEVSYIAVDRDPDRVARQRAAGKPIYFGDMTELELLRRLHLDTSRALVVTLDDSSAVDALGSKPDRGIDARKPP